MGTTTDDLHERRQKIQYKLQIASLVVLLVIGGVVLVGSGYFLASLKGMRDARIEAHATMDRARTEDHARIESRMDALAMETAKAVALVEARREFQEQLRDKVEALERTQQLRWDTQAQVDAAQDRRIKE